MGFRSFLSKKVLRKHDPGDGDDNNKNNEAQGPTRGTSPSSSRTSAAGEKSNSGKIMAAAQVSRNNSRNTRKSAAAAVAAAAARPKTVRMGEDPRTGEIDVESRLASETVQERIRRIKRGDMSADEKEAFLKSALSTGNTPESRLPMIRDRDNVKKASASPFPTDSILRNMARGNKPGENAEEPRAATSEKDLNSRKQKYLDMVTDPNRFDTYKNVQSPGLPLPFGGKEKGNNDNAGDDEEKDSLRVPLDLGARLGAAAMETEKRNAELRKQQLEQERELDRERQEREKRKLDAQRQRQEELAKREMEINRRRKEQEAEANKRKERSREREESRRAELLKAQDDYWTKKLAEGKRLQDRMENKKEPTKKQKEAERSKTEESNTLENDEKDKAEEEEAVATLPWFSGNNMINRAATEVFGSYPLNDVQRKRINADFRQSASGFQADQARKRADREREQDEQLARLRSLNSPLPARTNNQKPLTTSRRKPASFQPQKPIAACAQSLGDLTKSIRNPEASTNVPAPTREDAVPIVNDPFPLEEPALELFEEATANSGNPFNPFSRLTGSNKGKAEPWSTSTPQRSPPRPAPHPPTPGAPRPATAQKPDPIPDRKGPIRMQLPLGDEDEEPKMTDGMTIGEIMKRQKDSSSSLDQSKRSKQWGVDMSRFKK